MRRWAWAAATPLLLALALPAAWAAPAAAANGAAAPEPRRANNWTTSLFVANEKLYRGLRQGRTDAVFGLDLGWRGDTGWALAAGVAGPAWHGSYTSTELLLAGSRSWDLGREHRVQAGLARYEYVGSPVSLDRSFTELNFAWGWRDRASLALAVLPEVRPYSPRWRSSRGLGIALEGGWSQRLAGATTLELGLGHFDLGRAGGRSYTYGHLLLACDLGPLRWHLGRVDSDALARGAAGRGMAGGHWLASLSWTR
jgi:hypothetical protein